MKKTGEIFTAFELDELDELYSLRPCWDSINNIEGGQYQSFRNQIDDSISFGKDIPADVCVEKINSLIDERKERIAQINREIERLIALKEKANSSS